MCVQEILEVEQVTEEIKGLPLSAENVETVRHSITLHATLYARNTVRADADARHPLLASSCHSVPYQLCLGSTLGQIPV